MAYTYNDFLSAANTAGVMDRFTQSDLSVAQKNPEYGISMIGLLKDIGNASTSEQKLLATEAANQLRKNYGVYGTGDNSSGYSYASSYGSTINDLLDKVKNYGSFDYGGQDAYQKLLDSVVNQKAFSYDLASDPSYSTYKKQYLREGDRASANAMAQAAAASGGRASSYALTAAQQAGNYYAGQLSDIIPTLEQNAYSRYLSDFNNRLSSLSALETDRAFDYEKWMNEYNMLQNSLNNYQGQDATDYQRYLDAYNQMYQAEQDKLTQEQLAYENALTLYQTLGYATPEVAKILGIGAGGGISGNSAGDSSAGSDSGSDTRYDVDGVTTDTEQDGTPTIDLNSVLQLGYGPISESTLDELVESGEVREVVDGNVIRFEKVESPVKSGVYDLTKSLLSGITSKKSTSGSSTTSSSKKNSGSTGSGGGTKSKPDKVSLLM